MTATPAPTASGLAAAIAPRFLADLRAIDETGIVTPMSSIAIQFPAPVDRASITLRAKGQELAPAIIWNSSHDTAVLDTGGLLLPGQEADLTVLDAELAGGQARVEGGAVVLRVQALEPRNARAGDGLVTQPATTAALPLEIVVENSAPARPQSGLQAADTVFEYVSEYSISRMTAIYHGPLPATIGPVRSCRLINVVLTFAFHGVTMCSGASDGTLGQLWGQGVPVAINDYDHGGHFYRSPSRYAPHNLYTSADRAQRLRQEFARLGPVAYAVDTAHADAGGGEAAPAPTVPLHHAGYRYDPARQAYIRLDHGAYFIDALSGAPLAVKTVILMHVPFHDAGFTEDRNGGAHSIAYDVSGEGPAQVYSDGRVIAASWHMSRDIPLYLTDSAGRVLRLNTGLTWIHVLGDGQTH